MMRASVTRPFADLLAREMHDPNVHHFDGWSKKVAEGWTIQRVGPAYLLFHGRQRTGSVLDVFVTETHLGIELTNGLTCMYTIRQPRTPAHQTTREMVEEAVRQMPPGQPFTSYRLASLLPYSQGPTVRQVANILSRGDVAEFRDGFWYPKGVQ